MADVEILISGFGCLDVVGFDRNQKATERYTVLFLIAESLQVPLPVVTGQSDSTVSSSLRLQAALRSEELSHVHSVVRNTKQNELSTLQDANVSKVNLPAVLPDPRV